jgi:hypothetical protein
MNNKEKYYQILYCDNDRDGVVRRFAIYNSYESALEQYKQMTASRDYSWVSLEEITNLKTQGISLKTWWFDAKED